MISASIGTYTPVGQNALFAVKIEGGGASHERVVPLTSKNAYVAQLLAVKYVCEAVENKDVDLEITTSMPYITTLFQKDGKAWKKSRKRANSELVEEIKVLLDQFKSFSLVVDTSGLREELKTSAKSYSSI